MNIDQIQKINEMAVNLLRQGLATSRDEAVVQAEKFFKEQGESNYAQIRERMTPVAVQANGQQAAEPLAPDQIKEILEKNSSFMVKSIKEFQEKVLALEKEVADLRSRVAFNRPVQPAAPPLGEIPVIKQPAQANSQEKPAPHPRQGNWKSDDVSIEKFFYMGKR